MPSFLFRVMKNLWILALPFLLAGFETAHAENRLIIAGRGGTGDGFTLVGPDAKRTVSSVLGDDGEWTKFLTMESQRTA